MTELSPASTPNSKRILILGATGGIGVLLVEQALKASHTVVVYARSPNKLPEHLRSHANIVIHKGELTDEVALSTALEGVDAVLSALGPAVSRGPLHPSNTPLASAYELVIKLMKGHDIKRLIALGTPSIHDAKDRRSLIMSTIVTGVQTFAYNAYKDIVAIGKVVEESQLDWTIARVPLLRDKDDERFVAGYVGDGQTTTCLSRAGFVAFVVQELDRNEWVKAAPLITSP